MVPASPWGKPATGRLAAAGAGLALAASLVASGALPARAAAGPGPKTAAAGDSALVDTFVGSDNQGYTFPGASAPFGMTQVSPTTAAYTGYAYTDPAIRGFGTTYLSGAHMAEQGQVSMLPTVGRVGPGLAYDTTKAATFDQKNYAEPYTHSGEVGRAGYYKTTLTPAAGNITVEATATTRVGVQRYTFPKTANANVFVNVGQGASSENITSSSIRIVGDRTVVGDVHIKSNRSTAQHSLEFTTWFATRFDRPFTTSGTWDASGAVPGSTSASSGTKGLTGAYLTFDASSDPAVQASTAISYTGADGALANLAAEGLTRHLGSDHDADPIPFATIQRQTRQAWNGELGKFAISGGSAAQRSTFYTALYHAYLEPQTGDDADGTYRGYDNQLHTAKGWTYYQYFSLWDTFRSQNQFLAMFQPTRARDIATSLLAIRNEAGWLPRWGFADFETNVMGGDPVTSMLADLWRYGDLNARSAAAALLDNLDSTPPAGSQFQGRAGNPGYIADGYIAPASGTTDTSNAGSATLEYAAADCSAAPLFASVGDEADAQRLRARSGNWTNVWDPSLTDPAFGMSGFPRERAAGGGWATGGPQSSTVGFQEGTPWRYQWLTWQDFPGLEKAAGGNAAVLKRLDTFFSTDQVLADPAAAARNDWVSATQGYTDSFRYDPNNEPDLQVPWLYDFAGVPAKASAVVRAQQTLFTEGPGGITGNDDMGEMSAWYVFSALGIYPSLPGSGDLLLSAPLFPRIDVSVPDGTHLRHLTIRAAGADAAALEYIKGFSLNGNAQDKSYVNWDDLAVHGRAALGYSLTSDLTATTWGTAAGSRPVSMCTSVPTVTGADHVTARPDQSAARTLATVTASASALDGATARVNWGDGTSSGAQLATSGLTRAVTGSHEFRGPGLYQATVTIRSDTGSAIATTTVPVSVGPAVAGR
jgi:predicted alpha-1,2-mannosidase